MPLEHREERERLRPVSFFALAWDAGDLGDDPAHAPAALFRAGLRFGRRPFELAVGCTAPTSFLWDGETRAALEATLGYR